MDDFWRLLVVQKNVLSKYIAIFFCTIDSRGNLYIWLSLLKETVCSPTILYNLKISLFSDKRAVH